MVGKLVSQDLRTGRQFVGIRLSTLTSRDWASRTSHTGMPSPVKVDSTKPNTIKHRSLTVEKLNILQSETLAVSLWVGS